jgi:transposase
MRLHRKNGDTLIGLAMRMVNQIHQWLPERQFRLVADGFYATLAGKQMPQAHLVSRIQRNAKIFDLPRKKRKKTRGRPRKKGKRIASPQKMTSYIQDWKLVEFCQRGNMIKRLVYTRQVIWYWVSHQPILLVISRDPAGKERDDFLFTTDLTMTAEEVLECYNDRWAIEDTFKNTKQFLGGQQPQTYKGQGPERAAALSLCLYSMVWLWYLRQKSKARTCLVQPWYRQKTTPSFADALCCLRRELWSQRIKYMFGNSAVHDKKFEFLMEALASAA